MKKTLLLALLLGSMSAASAQPGPDCRWLTGYFEALTNPIYGSIGLNFCAGGLDITPITPPTSFLATNASISDEQGNLLCYTNGVSVFNASHQIMMNGHNLNPGGLMGLDALGLSMPQGALILPVPEQAGKYMLIHEGGIFVEGISLAASPLYYSLIDMELDDGNGAVVEKNVVLRTDTLEHGKIVATRHANGRDWWIVAPRYSDGSLLRLLLSPQGIEDMGPTQPGLIQQVDFGNATFSPDGRYYVNAGGFSFFTILGFDRCSGEFFFIEYYETEGFQEPFSLVAFAPNSRYLYHFTGNYVFQFDVEAADIGSSGTIVAEYDGYAEDIPDNFPATTDFYMPQLAPDGKIYVTTLGFAPYLHVIEQPDLPGTDCQVIQRGIELPIIVSSLPNFPNFNLGVLQGSPCDSIISSSTNHWPLAETEPLHIFPNPAQGYFTIATGAPGTPWAYLRLYDSTGRQVLVQSLAAGQPEHRIALPPGLPAGVYVAVAEGSEGVLGRGRVVVR
ncbi:MAG: T9SS type A sorting domain-containing protein [Saprospiraceae bacterium]|nr:T9SS type A sorting domain-containing protein [Saprospiraceae bacterium]